MNSSDPLRIWTGEVVIPTYLPAAPDKNPMFLEKRVYQGSSGKVYPLPFTDRIAENPVNRAWKAVWLENEFLKVLVLPEIGGRIHAIQDKTNGYDLIYNQHVIKPALVGLAGPWISGGIEFNWPQHHRPATFMPVDFTIEHGQDGSKTVWCSDHDPMERMKGMHGVCLHPGKAFVELKVRAYNRTPLTKTFLWWANVATRVHESYKSFFPPDVRFVADHARRATSEYPLAKNFYYGVNYGERARRGVPPNEAPTQFVPSHCDAKVQDTQYATRSHAPLPSYAPNDLSWYANIPTPCSYMCLGSSEDFFGGYDFKRQAGLVHYADHHISPGKKKWTWGKHEFGYAWDRSLTDKDANGEYGPYIELMAGVYTDNQPDFSFLQPGETKFWSQYWYPIQKIGPVQKANLNAAISFSVAQNELRLGVCVVQHFPRARIQLQSAGKSFEWKVDLSPGKPFYKVIPTKQATQFRSQTVIRVIGSDGAEIICYRVEKVSSAGAKPPSPATEPPQPADVASVDELYLIGLHLDQYRHASRRPTLYWREALKRDPGDSRCHNALGYWHLRRGEFPLAETHFRKAIERITARNPNPADGEPFYNLGLCLAYQGRHDEAYAAFYKSTWNQAWQAAGYHALAEIDCRNAAWHKALAHLDHSLVYNSGNTRARNLKTIVLRKLGREGEAQSLLTETLALDPLDWWAAALTGKPLKCDNQALLDIAHDYARAGMFPEAAGLLKTRLAAENEKGDLADQNLGARPLLAYTLGWLFGQKGKTAEALRWYRQAASMPQDYCFPARLEEIAILKSAIAYNPSDARAPYYLGNLLYDRRRHREAIVLWERSAQLDPSFPIVWRNLGMAYYNILQKRARARHAYEKAWTAGKSARLLFERDQLWKRLGDSPKKRFAVLEAHLALVAERDDLSVELCALYNQTNQPEKALALLTSRRFQPWEGGEGLALGQYLRARLALGQSALARGDASAAVIEFNLALHAPDNLAEAKHFLANQSDIHYWLGIAYDARGDISNARRHWKLSADFKGDFQGMKIQSFSDMTYYSAMSWRKLGRADKATPLLRALLAYARELHELPATVDYFATSLPTMLLFDDDLVARQRNLSRLLEAQARAGLGEPKTARAILRSVLRHDPNQPIASDLLHELSRKKAASGVNVKASKNSRSSIR